MTDLAGETMAMNMIEKLNEEHDEVLTENAKLHKELEVYKKLITKISLEVCEPHAFVHSGIKQRTQAKIRDIINEPNSDGWFPRVSKIKRHWYGDIESGGELYYANISGETTWDCPY
jgi:hypothetical protein